MKWYYSFNSQGSPAKCKRRAYMSTPKTNAPNQLALHKRLGLADRLGSTGVAIGIILVALGLILQEYFDGIGTAIRTLGGLLFLCGFAAVVFGESRRRAVALGTFRRLGARHMAMTANWGWPDRVGLAGSCAGWVDTTTTGIRGKWAIRQDTIRKTSRLHDFADIL